jgi:FkbM family methyltransferase
MISFLKNRIPSIPGYNTFYTVYSLIRKPEIPPPVHNTLINSYSQYGEDLVIDGIIGYKSTGFYVDIGANDPTNLNNTKRFSDRGWKGINIEPNPVLFKKLGEQRPGDINLNIGIGPSTQESPFYMVSADTLSSFNEADAERNCRIFNERIIEIMNIHMQPLAVVFETYCTGKDIDFMSVDVEGFELEVLQTNDWGRYRPYLIVIEINNNTNEILSYLKKNDYALIFRNHTNGIFVDAIAAQQP